MQYRPEIDGLRALAVIVVVLYHAGAPAFPGGFVGVDVFFVVSGYLITTLILTELRTGSFSLARFYERRARRILPALFLVLAVSTPFAWLWMTPDELTAYARGLAAVSLFVSNVLFWTQAGYFAAAAELNPLIHTWSLAIEEQFYLLFPLLMLALWRWGAGVIGGVLAVVMVASLAYSQWHAVDDPATAFYLLPSRAWELCVGALVAQALRQPVAGRLKRVWAESGTALGLAMIAYAAVRYDADTPFPGLAALLPTLGTALVIVMAGTAPTVGAMLRWRPLVGVGLVSYSVYLWHQPLFAFARLKDLEPPSAIVLASLGAASFALAYLSWRFVEQPWRRRSAAPPSLVLRTAAWASALFVAAGVAGSVNENLHRRSMVPTEINLTFKRTKRPPSCFGAPGIHAREDWLCPIGDVSRKPSFVLFGDSHALTLLPVVARLATERGLGGVFTGANGCVPLLGVSSLRALQAEQNCMLLNRRVLDHVRASGIGTVIFAARWSFYTDGDYAGTKRSYLGFAATDVRDHETSRRAFAHGVATTASAYAALGTGVYVVRQAPLQRYDPRRIYRRAYRSGAFDATTLTALSVEVERHQRLQAFSDALFDAQAGVRTVSLAAYLCDDSRCPVGDQTGSFYADDDHLSIYGAERVTDAIDALFVEMQP